MQSPSTSSKPLPPLPPLERGYEDLGRLSEPAGEHLAQTLRFALQAEALDQSWATLMRGALDDMADALARGRWVHGLKATRQARAHWAAERERTRRAAARAVKSADEPAKDVSESAVLVVVDDREQVDQARTELARLVNASPVPMPIGTRKHLLLTVAPLAPIAPMQDLDFDLVPNNRACTFTNGSFALPAAGQILFGLNEWHTDAFEQFAKDGHEMRLVGGTFAFAGVSSPEIYTSLVKVLRLAIYVRTSLLLEQRVLAGLHVPLKFPKLPTPLPSPDPSSRPPSPPPPSAVPHKRISRVTGGFRSAASSGIWSFISRKTESLLHRPSSRAGYSSDGHSSHRPSMDIQAPRGHAQRWSEDDGEDTVDTVRAAPAQHPSGKFGYALKHLEEISSVLSTSPNMSIPLPPLLVKLAEREKSSAGRSGRRKPRLLLSGDERTALEDLRGWDESDAFGFEETFTGFQQMTLLYSEHCPQPPRILDAGTDSILATITRCGPPRWVTYNFYAPEQQDECLGGEIERLCDLAREPCETCDVPRRLHTMTWIHDSVKITANVDIASAVDGKAVPEMRMWESCAVCSARNPAMPVDDAVYMYSFGKFLELLAYSKTFGAIPLALCSHTSLMGSNESSTPDRHAILRHVSREDLVVTFATAPVSEVYDVRVPRLQIVMDKDTWRDQEATITGVELEPEQEAVRQEIKAWWAGLRTHLEKLSEYFSKEIDGRDSKDLPPEPSSSTVTQSSPTLLMDSGTDISPTESRASLSMSTTLQSLSAVAASPSTVVSPSNLRSSTALLDDLRKQFEKVERDLYNLLIHTPLSSLNDVRHTFRSRARGIIRRLAAWQAKHAPAAVPFDAIKANEPEWWKGGCYPVPGGRVIVRDGEWGSIISCALSSTDYAEELANMRAGRPSSRAAVEPPETRPSTPSVLSVNGSPSRSRKKVAEKQLPDPDDATQGDAWNETEPVSTTTSRIDHPRDMSTLLNLRDVLRHKRSVDSTTGSVGSRFSSLGSTASRFINSISAPPSAWAKPSSAEISHQLADGKVGGGSEKDAEKELLRVVEQQLLSNTAISPDEANAVTGSSYVDVQTPRSTTPTSTHEDDSSSYGHGHDRESSTATIGPPVPPKDFTLPSLGSTPASEISESEAFGPRNPAASLTTTLANAMRFMLNPGTAGSDTPTRRTGSILHPLLGHGPGVDESYPHVKYKFTVRDRMQFSCTVYYARQFDELRRRCGVADDMVLSLARSDGWAAAGGKSKANFWKTADDRFVIKSLVNAWNVADLQVLNETAPAYFEYLDSTASKASVLAKLLGYYTVEIKNVESGTVQAKADLLVMENLFYDQSIAKTFDLKGIQGRKVKAKSKEEASGPRTLFDGEWIEGQQRALLLLRSHSKRVLQEAIRADADFLSKSNIMDYSLLLGIDQERKQIACGLVDTIGSYSFAKTLEYKAKQGLQNNLIIGSNKEVTVMPPDEYRDRFVKAIDGYFLACPDKWTKTRDSSLPPAQLYSIV
ncbi:hypothetical protein EXIGLDRAFT_641161 [Exidia glandulosa HHB12029]|uniref:PIPK domain-containing protein n=1 Tax=Exidia glandulosa HHB12029 TaxID=1314781 RepID=A0A166B8I3_EXIGL|nr:hypothetical protein EXIGLDRAFT_641161 [Exidia glandulosa HHB12029]